MRINLKEMSDNTIDFTEFEVRISDLWDTWNEHLHDQEKNYDIRDQCYAICSKVIQKLDDGEIHVLQQDQNSQEWSVNAWVQRAILLYFATAEEIAWKTGHRDLISLKRRMNFRNGPGSVVRHGSFVSHSAVVMPQSFINVGARVGGHTMIDSCVTVGSCAWVGDNCHVGAGTVIGGVLEPPGKRPVIVESNCRIGAQCSITEGAHLEEGVVLASGTHIASSTTVLMRCDNEYLPINAKSGHTVITAHSVVVPGSVQIADGIMKQAAIIIKKSDEKTKAKTMQENMLYSKDDE